MKFFRYVLGLFAAVTGIVALLIAAIEISAFGSRSFYEQQYEKNNVLDAVGMEMDNLMEVTDYMLDYLQGKHDTLSVTTTMWGEERDFFNERERAHMVDVQRLNLNAVTVMWCLFGLCISALLGLAASCLLPRRRPEPGFLTVLCRSVIYGTILFILLVGIGAAIVSTDFDHYWRIFHTIFFTNDLWLLDPATDMLINIVPLEFFIALVTKCALMFIAFILILLVPSVIYLVIKRKQRRRKSPRFSSSLLTVMVIAFSLTLSMQPCISVFAEGDDIRGLDTAPEISADAAILIERSTGTVLYAKNAEKSEYPASTTKVMTALLTLENADLDETVVFSKSAIYALTSGASHIGMTVGEKLSVKDCLYGLLLPSANEVANALAEHVDGSMTDFVQHMNDRAASLGCVNTHFANPNGLHDASHTTCAYDLALIFQACLSTPGFVGIDSAVTYVIGPTNLVDESRPMKTTHKMLQTDSPYYDERVLCGKTGHTPEAGGCLITYAEDGGMGLICVIMGAEQPNEYVDTKALLDYGFSSFSYSGSLDLSQLLAASDTAATFYTSPQIAPYSLTSTQALLTTDLSLLSFSVETNDDGTPASIRFSAGDLELSSIPVTAQIQTDNPQKLRGLPASYLQVMEKSAPNYLPWILLGIAALAVLILLFSLIYNAPSRVLARRQKSTRVFKNVNLKKIKI
jgi:integral membrane protein (TIGR01906 family)